MKITISEDGIKLEPYSEKRRIMFSIIATAVIGFACLGVVDFVRLLFK